MVSHINQKIFLISMILAFFTFSVAAQEELKYGSKVLQNDVDESRAMNPFYVAPIFAFVDAGIIGTFDPGDPVYIHIDPNSNFVSENDLRITPFGDFPAGYQVGLSDPDYGNKLSRFGVMPYPAVELRYFDSKGDKAYSIDDPVYLDINPGKVNSGDIRITGYMGYEAGSRVEDSDVDADKPTSLLPGMFNFFNANGNINNAGWAIYDQGDKIYIDTQYPFYTITINDIRMAI
mgnify:CR=1 FL=1